jgi:hypothetical protein
MSLGAAIGRPAFKQVYLLIRSAGALKADIVNDHPEPHRFAQGFDVIVLLGATPAWLGGYLAIIWFLSWLVIAFASINPFGGFCAGCAHYYWFTRLGLP